MTAAEKQAHRFNRAHGLLTRVRCGRRETLTLSVAFVARGEAWIIVSGQTKAVRLSRIKPIEGGSAKQ